MAEALPKHTFAMVQTGVRTLEPRELPIPEIDDDSALLRVEVCGICGSDYEQYAGVLRTPVPVIPGHEPLGRIAKLGDRAGRRWGVEVGDRVAVEVLIRLAPRHGPLAATRSAGGGVGCSGHGYVPLTVRPVCGEPSPKYMYLGSALLIVHKVRKTPGQHQDRRRPAARLPLGRPTFCDGARRHGARARSGPTRGPPAGARGSPGPIRSSSREPPAMRPAGARPRARRGSLIDVEQEDVARACASYNGRGADVAVEVAATAARRSPRRCDHAAPGGTVVLAGVKGIQGGARASSTIWWW